MSTLENKIAVFENELENFKIQLGRFRSTLESEDGTLLRLVRYVTDDVSILKKDIANMKIQIALTDERMNNTRWWVRVIIVAIVPVVIKLCMDMFQK